MKQLLSITFFLLLAAISFGQTNETGSPVTAVKQLKKCHTATDGTQTSFIDLKIIEVGKNTLTDLGTFTVDDAPYTVPTTGTIEFGYCIDTVTTVTTICQVQDEPDQDNLIGNSKEYPTNSLNSLTYTVMSGYLVVEIENALGTSIDTFPAGFTRTWHAEKDCMYLQKKLSLDSSNGWTKVAILR